MADDKYSSGNSYKFVLIAIGLVLAAFVAQGFFRVGSTPTIAIQPQMQVIGKKTPVKIEVSESGRGLSAIKIELIQGDKTALLSSKSYAVSSQFSFGGSKTANDTFLVEAGRQALPGLTGGTATIRVTVDRAGTWMRSPSPKVQELTLPVQLTPPTLQITSIQTYVSQGGCEAVAYRVGASTAKDGVKAGEWWFPGYQLPGGGKQDRFAIFAVPYDMEQPNVKLIAADAAGNEAQMGFIDKFTPKPPKSDTLMISDAFMNKVVPAILSQTPELKDRGDLLANFLAINRELRQKDGEIIKGLAQKSQLAFLWKTPFAMLYNSKVMAAFAEKRTYQYQGKVIDNQTHLGFDLALTKQAPIPAANDGVVVYARFFGIYGNAVVIDHGYGLQTIYGHMSSIAATEGQKVAKGDIIGKTGETGLAGGDHLHFTTILQGLPVNPVEWCDGHWVQDRIAKKIGAGFVFSAK